MLRWIDLRREPFRLLFPLGALCGCLGVGHWLVYAAGWSPTYSGSYHASMQTGLYMTCFVIGFLMTALPRFSSSPPASSLELAVVLALCALQVIGISLGRWVLTEAAWAGLLVLLAVFAGRRFLRRHAITRPPAEFVWIPLALLCGLTGSALLIIGQRTGHALALGVGRPLVQQGFLLAIVLGVGGFMAPRLLGRDVIVTTGLTPERLLAVRRRRQSMHVVAGLVLWISFLLEGCGAVRGAYLLRALVVTAELAWTTQWWRPPQAQGQYVRLLWLSLWLIVLGVWAAALLPRHRVAALHLVFLGGFSMMTFAVATMVVLSHSGEGQRLQRPLWVLRVVGFGVPAALAARLIAEGQPAAYFHWLGVASALWLIVGVSWICFVLPRVARPLAPGVFEAAHEAAKRHLLQTRPPEPSC